jgi:hypothetical protein
MRSKNFKPTPNQDKNMTDTKTAANNANANSGWMERFGVLEDVTERTSKKGDYVTFKLQAKGFVQYGACFNADVISQMKEAVGKNVWMKGPVDTHMGRDNDGNPKEMKSFKVIYFRLSQTKDEAAPVAEAA